MVNIVDLVTKMVGLLSQEFEKVIIIGHTLTWFTKICYVNLR
jgi:hypothetical protein